MSDKWIQRWQIEGSKGKVYTIAVDRAGNFGCSCPAWIYQKAGRKKDCKHIIDQKSRIEEAVQAEVAA
jgi:predicted nucleic acid-binding Zn finger protein